MKQTIKIVDMVKFIKTVSNGQLKRKQFRQKLSMLLSVTAHAKNIADQVMDLADEFMLEDEKASSDVLRVVENLSCVCEETLGMLVEEMKTTRK